MGVVNKKMIEVFGLTDMSELQCISFLPVIQEELEMRVGQAISMGLSVSQISEFEAIIDGDEEENMQWLKTHVPDYTSDSVFLALVKEGFKGSELINETASVIWLKKNRPDYQQVVEACQKEIRDELVQYRNFFIPLHQNIPQK